MSTCYNEPVCMKIPLEVFAITLNIISAVATIIHIYIISQLKKTEKSIFFTNRYYANVLDVLIQTDGFVGHACSIRKAMLDNIALALGTTAYAFILVLLTYASLLFSIIDRWLILSKAISYKSYGFVKKYSMWLSMVTIYTATITLLETFSLQAPMHSLKPLIALENVFYSMLDIFAFLKTSKSYQHKFKEIFLCARC